MRIISLLCLIFLSAINVSAFAKPAQKYASIIVDADTLEILHARKIDSARFPASTTKMMTLYLVFDALDRGQIRLNDQMKVSAYAAQTPPVKLGLRAGQTISVENAIKALTVRSANDVAVVIAEHLAGSEANFARRMNEKAKALGMTSTKFYNPHGLPNRAQITTARDMAKLAKAHFQNHAKYYHFFGVRSFHYKGRSYANHNRLLGRINGVDGFKTGYTNASGYNLVVSAKRDGHRIIAVVLGGASGASRDKHVADLVNRGFEVIEKNQQRRAQTASLYGNNTPKILKRSHPAQSDYIKAFTLRAGYQAPEKSVRVITGPQKAKSHLNPAVFKSGPLENWRIQIGAFHSAQAAQMANFALIDEHQFGLTQTQSQIVPVQQNGRILYRARFKDLAFKRAKTICQALGARERSCRLIAPAIQ